jgi:hypothetical protein
MGVLVIRKSGSIPTFTPVDSIIYSIGDSVVLGETVEYKGNDTTFTDSNLTNGVIYCYKIFTYDEVPNYSRGITTSAISRDVVSPSAIDDLIITSASDSLVTLKWTAVGDDDTVGIATKYDIRYYTESITDSSWDYAVKVADSLLPVPKITGTIDSITISGLSLKATYYFAIKVSDEVPNWSGLSNVVSVTITSLEKLRRNYSLPKSYHLAQNYPNPFNPVTYISYQLPENTKVKLKIYNITGQLVKVLVDELQRGGYYNIKWDGRDDKGNTVSSGLYIYRLETRNFICTKRMVLLK